MSDQRVLVVGTTSDYIHLIHSRFPGRALFITAQAERTRAAEPAPDPRDELLCDLLRPDDALAALRDHLARFDIRASGLACFDCESLALASFLARALALPYPSPDAVAACRSKFLSKQLWRRAGLPCPQAELVRTAAEAAAFLERIRKHAILKPLTGSGSELLFVCTSRADCDAAFATMRRRLAEHWDVRMYAPALHGTELLDPRQVFVAEELLAGPEYSCDFIADAGRVDIIRIARKVPASGLSAGTTLAYILPAALPPTLELDSFRGQLAAAAEALGIERAICMLDFIVEDDAAKMIEIAPRPGGDCLPWLIRQSCGLDVLGLALDFAEQRVIHIPPPEKWRRLVGLRLFVNRHGVISRLDGSALRADRRVLEVYLKRTPPHRVVLPPDDYDSRLLGHVIFAPVRPTQLGAECAELAAKLRLDWEPGP